MGELSEKLGLSSGRTVANRTRCVDYVQAPNQVEADRRQTVEAVALWLMSYGDGAELLTRGETDELIRRELLGEEGET